MTSLILPYIILLLDFRVHFTYFSFQLSNDLCSIQTALFSSHHIYLCCCGCRMQRGEKANRGHWAICDDFGGAVYQTLGEKKKKT